MFLPYENWLLLEPAPKEGKDPFHTRVKFHEGMTLMLLISSIVETSMGMAISMNQIEFTSWISTYSMI